MFSASENWVRTPPAARDVEPPPSCPLSTRTTSMPASARWKAALTPITPPPTITTSAERGRAEVGRGIYRGIVGGVALVVEWRCGWDGCAAWRVARPWDGCASLGWLRVPDGYAPDG